MQYKLIKEGSFLITCNTVKLESRLNDLAREVWRVRSFESQTFLGAVMSILVLLERPDVPIAADPSVR